MASPAPAAVAAPATPLRNGISATAATAALPKYCAAGAPLDELCASINARISSFLNETFEDPLLQRTQAQTRTSLEVVRKALEDYSPAELALSFNGGKDCLVLLLLYLAGLHSRSAALPATLQGVYVMSAHPFPEVDAFVDASVDAYRLELARYALPMKFAFETYLREKPSVKTVFVGTRRTDPHGADLTHFDMTDHGWPKFMRCHPVIDWHYQEVWAFLRHLEIPYCPLYDKGYTSLGGTTDTHPNPALRKGEKEFRPAYELVEDEQERLGREKR